MRRGGGGVGERRLRAAGEGERRLLRELGERRLLVDECEGERRLRLDLFLLLLLSFSSCTGLDVAFIAAETIVNSI